MTEETKTPLNVLAMANDLEAINVIEKNFYITNFTLGKEHRLTPWASYKRILREIEYQITQRSEISKSISRLTIDLERAERELQRLTEYIERGVTLADKKDLDLDLEEAKLSFDYTEQSLTSNQDEFDKITDVIDLLTNEMSIIKPQIDTLLKTATKEDLERDYHVMKLINEAELQTLASHLGGNTELISKIRGMKDPVVVQHIMSTIKQIICESFVDTKQLYQAADNYMRRLNEQKKQQAKNGDGENADVIPMPTK